jgi:hypothetical protein
VEVTPSDHPDRAARLASLGYTLTMRFERSGDLRDLEEAIRLLRELTGVTRQDVLDYCGVNGGVQSYQTLTGERALDFLEAVDLGLVAETVRMIAKSARRARQA